MVSDRRGWSPNLAWSSFRMERVTGDLHRFPIPRKHKTRICPVEGRVGSVYGTVVVRTDEDHIVQRIITAPAQPVYVARLTEIPSVQVLRDSIRKAGTCLRTAFVALEHAVGCAVVFARTSSGGAHPRFREPQS